MEKAIFYVRAMRGEGTGESYEDIIARYQAKMQEKGICEIVDSYADWSPLDDLIESDSLIEIKGMCQEQECKYLVIEGEKGLFVSMPQRKEGEDYKDVFHPITAEAREELNKQIMDAYEQKLEEEQGEQLDDGADQEPVTQTM